IAGNQHKRRGFICLWYSEVGLDLKLSYTTYVARAGWSPACRAAIKAHEERHATVNREFAEQLGRELTASLNYAVKRRSMFGPYYPTQEKDISERMNSYIHGIIASHLALMQTQMDDKHREVDNLVDAIRTSRICSRQGR
ncbi:MAG: hypothetical protein KKA05_08200, partial [Alphaproteobacteria bacterium]|nr:hypothetical protein [Alphaproteobacteria bacterium]